MINDPETARAYYQALATMRTFAEEARAVGLDPADIIELMARREGTCRYCQFAEGHGAYCPVTIILKEVGDGP